MTNFESFDSLEVCQVRLDFSTLVLTQPDTGATAGACSNDQFTMTTPTGNSVIYGNNLCGTLTGQHIYIETGMNSNAATFTITKAATTFARTWSVSRKNNCICFRHLKME